MHRRDCLLGLLACAAPATLWAAMADTVARIKPSVVLVGTWRETDSPRFQLRGSGFVVGSGLHVATCGHVVTQAGSDLPVPGLVIQALGPDGQWLRHPVKVLSVDREGDLALLSFDAPAVAPVAIADSAPVREGDDLAFMGFPIGNLLGYSHVVHRAMVSSITPALLPSPDAGRLQEKAIRSLRRGNYTIFQLDAVAYPGNSGGPLFRPDTGEVVGIMNMVLVKTTREAALSQPSGIAYAVPSARLLDLLEHHR